MGDNNEPNNKGEVDRQLAGAFSIEQRIIDFKDGCYGRVGDGQLN